MARILCVDDDAGVLTVYSHIVRRAGKEFVGAENAGQALHLLQAGGIDLIVTDFQLPGIDGIELVEMLRRERDRTPIMMVTGHGSVDQAMKAIRAGANDYLLKPFDQHHFMYRIDQLLARQKLERELDELRREMDEQRTGRRLLGRSAALDRALSLVAAAARSRATVLLEGESGTGKELVAREIHQLSDRRDHPFVRVNCAALPEGLIESALFGHEKGAFTGAIRRVEGAFERADGGTLLLDEITEMRVDLQAKLLRVLQEREFERVGGAQTLSVDVRIIATTNRDLAAEVERGTFRRDLYYRLNVIGIVVPPLRDRLSDVPILAHHFASLAAAESGKEIDAISADAIDLLQRYEWPGNVRELQHAVERAVVLAPGRVLDVAAFDAVARAVHDQSDRPGAAVGNSGSAAPRGAAASSDGSAPYAIALPTLDLAKAEAAIIDEALRVTNNNRTHAAALLGIGVRTLRKKLNAPASPTERAESPAE